MRDQIRRQRNLGKDPPVVRRFRVEFDECDPLLTDRLLALGFIEASAVCAACAEAKDAVSVVPTAIAAAAIVFLLVSLLV